MPPHPWAAASASDLICAPPTPFITAIRFPLVPSFLPHVHAPTRRSGWRSAHPSPQGSRSELHSTHVTVPRVADAGEGWREVEFCSKRWRGVWGVARAPRGRPRASTWRISDHKGWQLLCASSRDEQVVVLLSANPAARPPSLLAGWLATGCELQMVARCSRAGKKQGAEGMEGRGWEVRGSAGGGRGRTGEWGGVCAARRRCKTTWLGPHAARVRRAKVGQRLRGVIWCGTNEIAGGAAGRGKGEGGLGRARCTRYQIPLNTEGAGGRPARGKEQRGRPHAARVGWRKLVAPLRGKG